MFLGTVQPVDMRLLQVDGICEIPSLKDAPAAALKIQSIFTWIWALIYENTPPSNDQKIICNNDLTLLKSMMSLIQQHYQEKVTLNYYIRQT